MLLRVCLPLALVLTIALPTRGANPVDDSQWGDLTGEFVFDGPVPKPRMVTAANSQKVASERLVVDPKSGGVANIVVHLLASAAAPVRLVHPDLQKSEVAATDVKLSVQPNRFEPHVVLVRTTQTLDVSNAAPFGVSLKIDPVKNTPQYASLTPGKSVFFRFPQAEPLPVKIGVTIQSWYGGYCFVQDHPYMAKTDADGRFEIKKLPVGKWTFQFWHEIPGYLKAVTRNQREQILPKGKLEIEIRPGKNDLGQMLVRDLMFIDYQPQAR